MHLLCVTLLMYYECMYGKSKLKADFFELIEMNNLPMYFSQLESKSDRIQTKPNHGLSIYHHRMKIKAKASPCFFVLGFIEMLFNYSTTSSSS